MTFMNYKVYDMRDKGGFDSGPENEIELINPIVNQDTDLFKYSNDLSYTFDNK